MLHPEQAYDWDEEEEMEVPRDLTPVKISELLPLLEKLIQLLRQETGLSLNWMRLFQRCIVCKRLQIK
ncbi:hypothetical protein QNI22_22420 [Cytophagaceae bacterium BD1B2-1]|uniref:Uncharacterized protein n=1 Tax=Xanthocytophaga agilis TaxID=3048010 RepID=A0AAE3R3Z3_9BACT|nr:hypothetical protein [Xanthocytophaga agilis]